MVNRNEILSLNIEGSHVAKDILSMLEKQGFKRSFWGKRTVNAEKGIEVEVAQDYDIQPEEYTGIAKRYDWLLPPYNRTRTKMTYAYIYSLTNGVRNVIEEGKNAFETFGEISQYAHDKGLKLLAFTECEGIVPQFVIDKSS
jgi:hypothetical protein